VIVLSLLTILGIILGVTITKDDGPPPMPVPPIEKVIEMLSLVSSDGGEALQTPGSAQHDALSWLANDTFQGYYTDDKLIQRYLLATLFFSTNGKNWFNKSMWLDKVTSVIDGGNPLAGFCATLSMVPSQALDLPVTTWLELFLPRLAC
jgi:hypothetical protein